MVNAQCTASSLLPSCVEPSIGRFASDLQPYAHICNYVAYYRQTTVWMTGGECLVEVSSPGVVIIQVLSDENLISECSRMILPGRRNGSRADGVGDGSYSTSSVVEKKPKECWLTKSSASMEAADLVINHPRNCSTDFELW